MKKVCFQTEILGNSVKYIYFLFYYFVYFFIALPKDQFAILYFSLGRVGETSNAGRGEEIKVGVLPQ